MMAQAGNVNAVEVEGALPPLPDDLASLESQPAFRQYDTVEIVGAAKPTVEEEEQGAQVTAGAPTNTSAYKVAQYFKDVGDGKTKKEWAKFSREWPVRANPVIMTFFKATETAPHGDITPWCAAFVNWCIARGASPAGSTQFTEEQLAKTTLSAASGSFRCWKDTATPQPGDLVVFAQTGTERFVCSGTGHVGFFLGIADDGRIRVLGGNQTLSGTSGAVTVARFPKKGAGSLKLVGFKTRDVLHV